MGATVNPYLTKKAMQKKPLALPVAAVCGFFALGAAAMTFDLFSEGQSLYGVMALLSLATLLEPIVHIFIRFRRSLCAQHIAESLLLLTAESLTFDQLQNALFSCKAPQQIEVLISKGYLQNLKIDSAARTVTRTLPRALLRRGSARAAAEEPYAKGQPFCTANTATSRLQKDR